MSERGAYRLDGRGSAQLEAEIARLAASYVPAWQFTPQNPDIGSVIALVFAGQMAGNVGRMNRVLEKYHTEFVNMLDLSLLPAYPAGGVAVMELIEDTVAGVDVPKGTRLLSYSSEGEAPVPFETTADLHITAARLTDIFTVSPAAGTLTPLRGVFERPKLVEGPPAPAGGAAEPAAVLEAGPPEPMALFGQGEGIQQNALLLYHKSVFNTSEGVDVLLRLTAPDGADLSAVFADPARYRWSYAAEGGLVPFGAARAEGGALRLSRAGELGGVPLFGEDYALVCCEALAPVTRLLELGGIGIASECSGQPPLAVYGAQDLQPGRFMPFGESVSLFDECYIGHDGIFSQRGAEVRLSFTLSTRTKLVTMTPEQQEAELKVIKRRPVTLPFATVDTAPQRVSFEYYNGAGWRRLPVGDDWSALFDGSHGGKVELSFICPDDWQPMAVGYEGRSLRLRVTQADNCYLQPCRHAMPLIENLRLAYAYTAGWEAPQRLRRLCGTAFTDLTLPMLAGKPLPAFAPLPYGEAAVYLGFDRPFASGPVSLWFDLVEGARLSPEPLRFEYSAPGGFAPLKSAVDHTANLSRSGALVFMPPVDFAPRELEGKRRHWLRVTSARAGYETPARMRALVRDILPNAVSILNTRTLPEELFYVEAAVPGMRFALAAENILSAEVFVSELDRLSPGERRRLLAERPGDVRAEYNILGEMVEFMVRWDEVENFSASAGGARHYVIDRMTGSIRFGDGVAAAIPAAREGPAFTVRCVCCDGERGNLPTGAIDSLFGNILYVDRVYNPAPTSAGSNLESLERAHKRGANLISSKGRLVSEEDFTREVLAFSSAVDKVKCVIGYDVAGRAQSRFVTVAVLMNEYGSPSFEGVARRLRERLLPRCEATLDADCLAITEPLFVRLSVEVWASTARRDDAFAIRDAITGAVAAYLDPLAGNRGAGWEIGTLPTVAQLRQMLYAIPVDAAIRTFMVTARYPAPDGTTRECELEKLPHSPFMLGVNGSHRVHFNLR